MSVKNFIARFMYTLLTSIYSSTCMEPAMLPASFLIQEIHHDLIQKIMVYSLTPYINCLSPYLDADDNKNCILTLKALEKTLRLKYTLHQVCKHWDTIL